MQLLKITTSVGIKKSGAFMVLLEGYLTQKQSARKFFLLVALIFLMLLVGSVYGADFCCTATENSSAYCVEFSSEADATAAGCDVVENNICEFTGCAYVGCCPDDCSWKRQDQCFSASFKPFTACEDVSSCSPTCCVLNPDTNPFPTEGYGSGAWEDMCDDNGGDWYPNPCSEVEDFSGSYGSLYGYVKDTNLDPLAGVTVFAGAYSAVTNGEGKYRFSNIPTSSSPGYSLRGYFKSYSQTNTVYGIVTRGGDDPAGDDILMAYDTNAVVTIKGNVKDSYGAAIVGAIIIINNDGDHAVTDSIGYYELVTQITAGTYDLTAKKSGYNSESTTVSVEPGERYGGNDFTLVPTSGSATCQNGVLDPTEECDEPFDSACPGQCRSDCTCPPKCEDPELGYYCADILYQCTNNNGDEMTSYASDCDTNYNAWITNGGICCDTEPTDLPICIPGETAPGTHIGFTDIIDSTQPYCKCGNYIGDSSSSTIKYCCLVDGVRNLTTSECETPGTIQGFVKDQITSNIISGVRIQLSGVYQTSSNSSSGVNYKLDTVAAGRYSLTATKLGYDDKLSTVDITAGGTLTHNIYMNPTTGLDTPLTLTLSHVKGKPYVNITITVSEYSAIGYFEIYKEGILIAHIDDPTSSITLYQDNTTDWGTSYNYNVTAYSSFAVIDSDASTITTGDSACESVYNSNQFCGSSNCFSSGDAAYCPSTLGEKLKYRLVCTSNNQLSYAGGSASNSACSDVCVETAPGVTVCSGNDECETMGMPPNYGSYSSDLGNIFGLFYFEDYSGEDCNEDSSDNYKFCYYDYFYSDISNRGSGSYAIVDQCLSCNPQGFCYNYQSEDSCLEDHCNFGRAYNTSCKWEPTFDYVGRGICYSDDTATTDYCDMCDVTNPVFYNSNCTQDVCDLLGLCVATQGFTSCDACTITSTCDMFDNNEQACVGNPKQPYEFQGYPQADASWSGQCNSSTLIQYSDDTCGVGFCKYLSSSDRCIKDANDDGAGDCNGSADVSCGQDRSIPSTTLNSQTFISLSQKSLSFDVVGTVANTYYCFSDTDKYCCPNNKVTSGSIMVPNANYNYSNLEANKKLWYYSDTQYGNPEPINNITITIDNKPPILNVTYTLSNSSLSPDTSDVTIIITSHETARECDDSLVGQGSYSQMTSDVIDAPTPKTVVFPDLSDGSYVYTVSCEDMFGNTNTTTKNIHVDRVQLIQNPQPNFVTLPYSKINLSLETNDEEYACYFKMFDPRGELEQQFPTSDVVYTSGTYYYYSRNHELTDSNTYQYYITCYEDATKSNRVDKESIIFTIDEIAPTSNAYIDMGATYESIITGKYYTNPTIKINCSDPPLGPPLEFGCSQLSYCLSPNSCSPTSSGTTMSVDNYEFQPVVTTSGRYYLCIQSEDSGGNQEVPHCTTIDIDLLPPNLTIDTPANNNVMGVPTFEFIGTWRDQEVPASMVAKVVNENGLQMTINNIIISGTTVTGSYKGTIALNDAYAGINTLTVAAVDASGNYETTSINFYYDIYAPLITQAEILGEGIVQQTGWFIIGGNAGNVEIELGFFQLTLNQNIVKNHEYGNRLKSVLTTNDDNYTDISNLFGSDVGGNVTINSVANPAETYSSNLTYNSTGNNYYAIFTDAFDIGNYSVVYDVKDKFGNYNNYSHIFSVNDTVAPYFQIRIFDQSGANVTEVQYGTYEIEIRPSEPISQLYYLNYTISGNTKYIPLTVTNGTLMKGTLTISQTDLDLRELVRGVATFYIYGEDMHGRFGTTITDIKQFYITTAGPMQPIILTPDVSTAITSYSSTDLSIVEGMVYEDTDIGLKSGRVVLMKNTLVRDYADGSWAIHGETTTTENSLHHQWEYSRYGDSITYRSNDTINLHDYNNSFVVGRYIEFKNHQTQNRKLYKIIARDFTNMDGVKELYDITVEPELIGFSGFTAGDQFEDDIDIYDTDTPNGWFNFSAVLDQSSNHFYARAYDGPNEGPYSSMFTIIYDNVNPVLINTSPADGTLSGDVTTPIYAYVDPTGSNVSSYIMMLNGSVVSSTLTYDNGYAKIDHPYSGQLNKGNYTATVIVTDMAGNTLNHQWNFQIDPDAPLNPQILPSGVTNDTTPLVSITFPDQVVVDEATLEGTSGSYSLNLTSVLSLNSGSYMYQLTGAQTLVEGDYEIEVLARRIVGADYGTQGTFLQSFSVDTTPPTITQTNDPIINPNLPVYITVQIDEPAVCKYGFYDVPYDDLPYSSRVEIFDTTQTLPVYELPRLNTTAYVRCMDRAGNKMIDRAVVSISVDSLLFPAPKIYIPGSLVEVSRNNQYTVIGSTFDDPDPLKWVPDVSLIIAESQYFFTKDVDFDQKYYTQSLPDTNISTIVPDDPFSHDQGANAIIIEDMNGIFQKDLYVEFTQNRRVNYTAYLIKSVVDVSGTVGSNMVMVSFYDTLPAGLDTSQILYVYDQKAPPGWFDYTLTIDEGNNFFYAVAVNSFGEGEKTEVYNLIKDTTNPTLYNEFPRNGEIIGEESIIISITADGTYSQIQNADFTVDSIPVNPQIVPIKDYESKVKYQTTQGNGLHTVYVKAYDESDNTAEANWSFTINARAPGRPIILPNNYTNDTTPFVRIQFPEDVDLQSARVSGNGFFKDFTNDVRDMSTSYYTYQIETGLTEGEYKIEASASKRNISDPVAGYWYDNFVVDLTPPVIISIPASITTTQNPVEFLMITDEDAYCRFSESDKDYYDMENDLDSRFQKNHYVSALMSLSVGSLYIRCRDIAGNVMDNSKVVSVNQGTSVQSICGDGMITGVEECDGNQWGGVTNCQTYNNYFTSGMISCDPSTCRFDTTQCVSSTSCQTDADCLNGEYCVSGICSSGQAACGNGQIESGEECDGSTGNRQCNDFGFNGGTLKCTNCEYDTTSCQGSIGVCGDGNVNIGEECDGTNWGNIGSCVDYSSAYTGGTISCSVSTCKFETGDCIEAGAAVCGNDVVELGETCDGPDFGSVTGCTDLPGFKSGTLKCNQQNCHFDTLQCVKNDPVCGNSVLEEGEQCEGSLGGKDCTTFGFDAGLLSCDNCMFDVSACEGASGYGVCNDGQHNIGEQCDAPHYPFTQCSDMNSKFTSGLLTCDNNCMLSTEECTVDYQCYDGVVNPGEECDSLLGVQAVQCQLFDTFGGGALSCSSDCLFNTSQCIVRFAECNDGYLDAGEQCDPLLPQSISCTLIDSYLSGNIGCDEECKREYTACSKQPIYVAECGNNQIDEETGEQCEAGIIVRTCEELGLGGAGVYPGCYSPGTANECKYDLSACPCVEGSTSACNLVNPIYVDGDAICTNGVYDMASCWYLDTPTISVTPVSEVQTNYVDLTGTVGKARKIELYVEGVLEGSYNYSSPQEYAFAFNNVFLPKTTLDGGDGINNVTFIVYGVFPSKNFTYEMEIVVDITGPTIQILEPFNLRSRNGTPLVKINTTKSSTCKISYISFSVPYTQDFLTSDGFVHSVLIENTLTNNQNNPITIICIDSLGNNVTYEGDIFVDTYKPVIEDVILMNANYYQISNDTNFKHILFYQDLNDDIQAVVDSLVRCRYGVNTYVYGDMIDYDLLVASYVETWNTGSPISSLLQSLSIYTICEDEAGWESEPYELKIDIDPNADLTITNNNPQYVNEGQYTLNITTNRLANCTARYDGVEEDMIRIDTFTGGGFMHYISVSEFGLELVHDSQYDFEIYCEVAQSSLGLPAQTITFSITPDLIPPSVVIVNPQNNDVFTSQQINVEVQTERVSDVMLYVNNTLQQTVYTESGNVVFGVVLRNGSNDITVVVEDKGGNQNSTSITVYYLGEPIYPEIRRIHPAQQETVQSLKVLYAFVWVVYGADLDLAKSDIVLKNEQGTRILGTKAFTSGTPEDPVGNFTYTLSDSLQDGDYTWEIIIVDEFGHNLTPYYASFKVDGALPVITLTEPISISSASATTTSIYLTNESRFTLKGIVESVSPIIESYYQLNKGSGFEANIDLQPNNGLFEKIVNLDEITVGQTKDYVLKITVKNQAGLSKEFEFDIIHDREAPEPVEIIVE